MNAWLRIIACTTLATLALVAAPRALTADGPSVAYPAEYRSWTHVKSMLIDATHPLANPFEGLHHIYANAAALEGYRSGQFPDGAVIVFDLLAVSAADGAIVEAGRKLVGVMEKDGKRFAATGGWGYEGFAGDSRDARLVTDGGAGCFGCHTAQRESDYVFSAWRD